MKSLLSNFFWGLLMGIGELVPGVGMQTVAIIIGIYDELIAFLYQGTEFLKTLLLFFFAKASKEELKQSFLNIPWKLGLPIAIGVGTLIVAASHTISGFFESYPNQIAAAAFGIILASVFIPFKEMTSRGVKEIIVMIASFAGFFLLFGQASLTTTGTEPSTTMFLVGGLLASFAGFFPGISISFALLVMGLYEPLLALVGQLTSGTVTLYAISSIILFFIGLVAGLLICVRLLAFFIERHKSLFLAFIVGLIAASLRTVWPFISEGHQVAPWDLHLSAVTQQIIILSVSFMVITFLRLLVAKKSELAASFGQQKRTVLTS
jgi:putative membrane protein